VTREVNAYIRAQKLQDKDNGRKINPDAKLLKLLKLKKGEELTYFNLQKYMAAHFAKSVPSTAAASAAGGAVKA
jgi:chromatin remodeling complex protein RSC6